MDSPCLQSIKNQEVRMKKFICAVFVMIFCFPFAAYSAEPMEDLKVHLDEVINVLKDPNYQNPSQKDAQAEKIWGIIRQVFDFDRIATLALGKYRDRFNDKQLKDFTDVFSRLLEDTYLKKIQAEYKNEKVNYLDQKIKGDRALVATEIIRENVKIPVDYIMWRNDGVWRIYDVKVEKVSLVKNYRSQFEQLLGNESKSPDELIEQVRKKVGEQKK
jgi:phospholipid transport system substrate-binding protein